MLTVKWHYKKEKIYTFFYFFFSKFFYCIFFFFSLKIKKKKKRRVKKLIENDIKLEKEIIEIKAISTFIA